ncbi:hypothetical protein [Roseovarius sp. MMSF_3305]|nr:hypothetical protein [Roseovarius sp. MMSF_3305]
MYRRFIATILATAVAITGLTAAPARADNDDLLKILGGVAAIAIIGAAIKEARDDDKVSRNYPYYGHRPHKSHRKHRRHTYQGNRYDNHGARPLPKRVQRKLLPASCRVNARRNGQRFVGYSNWCLDRKFHYTNALPRECAVTARILRNNKRRLVYRSGCLGRYGYAAAQY